MKANMILAVNIKSMWISNGQKTTHQIRTYPTSPTPSGRYPFTIQREQWISGRESQDWRLPESILPDPTPMMPAKNLDDNNPSFSKVAKAINIVLNASGSDKDPLNPLKHQVYMRGYQLTISQKLRSMLTACWRYNQRRNLKIRRTNWWLIVQTDQRLKSYPMKIISWMLKDWDGLGKTSQSKNSLKIIRLI